MEKLKQFKDFYLSHKMIITLLVSMMLLFASSFWFPIMFVLMAFLIFSYIISNITEILSYTVFFVMFSGILPVLATSLACTLLVVFVKYIIDVIKKQVSVYKYPLMLTTAICVLSTCIGFCFDSFTFGQGAVIIALLYFVYVIFAYRKQINARKCCDFLLYGVIASIIMSVLFYLLPVCKSLVYNNASIKMMSIKPTMFYDDGSYRRLVMLTFHINHLASFVSFGVAYAGSVLLGDRQLSTKEKIFYIISLVLTLAIGLMTLSKSFMILMAIMFVILFVVVIKKYKLKSLYFVGAVLILCCVGVALFHDNIEHMLSRFVAYDGSLLNNLTTGRMDIWKTFIKDMFNSPIKIIFGSGFLLPDVVSIGTHSLYLFVFYRFGFVGTALLGVLAWTYLKACDTKIKINLKNILPLVIILLFALQEACVDERFIFVIVGMLFAFLQNDKELSKIEDVQNLEKISPS